MHSLRNIEIWIWGGLFLSTRADAVFRYAPLYTKCVFLFVYFIVQAFDHTLMRKGSVVLSCRAKGSKYFSSGMVHQGIFRRVLRGTTYDPGHWTFYFCRRGFGLVVSVVVPLINVTLAVLPYAREVAGSILGLDFYLLSETICVSLRLLYACYMYRLDLIQSNLSDQFELT
jgi:hypothetical protein